MKICFDEILIKNTHYIKSGTFEIHKGKINILLGKNGTGKSLLLSYIHTQIEMESTLISQKNDEILPSLTVEENVTLTLEKNKFQITELLEKFNLSYLLELKPKNLSGGEKRILAIIRGLLSDSSFILIDEPTNDLDYKRVDQLLQLLKEYCEQKTFLIVTHDDRVQEIADTIYVLENQKIRLIKSKEKEIHRIDYIFSNSNEDFIEKKDFNKSTLIRIWNVLKYQFNALISRDLKNLKSAPFKSKHAPNRIQKMFPFHLCFPLFFAVIIIFTFYTLEDANSLYFAQLDSINPSQVDIMSPITIRQDNLTGALPISLIQLILDTSELPTRNELETYVDRILNAPLSFITSSLESEKFVAFPLEYWQQNEGRFLQPFEVYVEYLLGEEIGSIFVDPSRIFVDSLFDPKEEATVPMDPQLYLEADRILRERYGSTTDPLKFTYIVLVLNDSFDIFELIASEDLEEILNRNYWIRSNETIFILNQVHVFSTRRDFINQWLVISAFLFTVNILFCALYLIANRKKVIILKNYGFAHLEIKTKLAKRFRPKALHFLSYLCLFLVNLKFVWYTPLSETFIGFLPSLLSVLSLVLSSGINRFVIHFYSKQLCHWKSR